LGQIFGKSNSASRETSASRGKQVSAGGNKRQ
jgi:hypothetical protein